MGKVNGQKTEGIFFGGPTETEMWSTWFYEGEASGTPDD